MSSQRFTSGRFSQRFDMTRGDILTKLLQLSLPIVVTQLLLMSYNMVDMFLLGRLSPDAVAAAGAAGMYMWLAAGVQLVGRMGAEIGVAQFKGRGDRERAFDYSHNSLFLAAATGLVIGILFVAFPRQAIDFMNIREEHVASDAAAYLRLVGPGMPLSFIAASVAGTFTGAGNSRAPLLIMTAGLAVNALLDPLLIFTLGLGVRGAAIATVIGQGTVCALSIGWLLRKTDRPFRQYVLLRKPVWKRIRHIFGWTLPLAAESLLFCFIAMLMTRYIAEYGSNAIAVYRVGNQIEALCWLICIGFASGITAFVGQNFGAGRWTRIREGLNKSLAVLAGWCVFVSLLFLLAGRWLFGLIIPEPGIMEMGGRYLWIVGWCQVFFALETVAGGGFRGLGRTAPSSIASIASNVLRIAVIYFLSKTDAGLEGIWWTMCATATLRGLWSFVWFTRYVKSHPHLDDE